MYYAYVLKSISHDYFYKGHCKEMDKRLLQHNSGMTTSIKPYIPFEVAYFEKFATESQPFSNARYLCAAFSCFSTALVSISVVGGKSSISNSIVCFLFFLSFLLHK